MFRSSPRCQIGSILVRSPFTRTSSLIPSITPLGFRFNSKVADTRLGVATDDQAYAPYKSRPADYDKRSWRAQSEEEPQSLPRKMLEAALTSLSTIVVLGVGFALTAYGYHKFYKWLVIYKIEKAFKPGDPVLAMAAMGKKQGDPGSIDIKQLNQEDHWIPRDEQAKIDAIIDGTDRGHYHLIIGEKGTGKSSMLIDAMSKVDGEGISMMEAHADLEIFRVRLGKAIDFEFHEDYIGSYFSEKGPRDSTALLDIERAFNKLEKVAMKRRSEIGRPLVLIINSTHLLRDDDDGRNLLELLQQRAEQWAAANLATIVFNSDEYWIYERLKQLATRMEVTSITDLPKTQAMDALAKYRNKYFRQQPPPSQECLEEIYDKVGGRLTFLNRVARSPDMIATCDNIIAGEKTWFLNQCWILGMEMDDDVMDQQKYASAAMVLAKALVDAEDEADKDEDDNEEKHESAPLTVAVPGPEAPASDDTDTPKASEEVASYRLPAFPLHIARYIMTRADFIQMYDQKNIFTITSSALVRADSVPMQRAFREICTEEGFDERLEATLQRISDIESLGRTRELVAKDLVNGGRYIFGKKGIELVMPPEEEGK